MLIVMCPSATDFIFVSSTAFSAPILTVTKTHSGTFSQGDVGDTYTITVTNGGSGPTAGTVTVTDNLPSGLTATAISGSAWTCPSIPSGGTAGPAPLTCTRSAVLASGASYPPITLTVNVASTAPSSITNSASVSGGGTLSSSSSTANDVTSVGQVVCSNPFWKPIYGWDRCKIHVAITVNAGWNMVGGYQISPPASAQAVWAYSPSSGYYQPSGSEPAGTGVWEKFSSPTSQDISVAECAGAVTLTVVPKQWNLVGNPCSAQMAVPGGLHSYSWNQSRNAYDAVTTLGVGQGAWVYPSTNSITLSAPSSRNGR